MTEGRLPRVYQPAPPEGPPSARSRLSQSDGRAIGLLVSLGVPALGLAYLMLSDVGSSPAVDAFVGQTMFLVGVTQVAWLVPAWIVAHAMEIPGMAAGLAIGGGLVALVNALCHGLVLSTFGAWVAR